jgi:RHS repeat-associated protein
MPTDIGFTGQRLDATGLMFYQARYYSAVLGRFVSADTIVPKPANPQSLNRFAYVLNNPIRHIDPTGHKCIEDDECDPQPSKYSAANVFGILFSGDWAVAEKEAVLSAAVIIDRGFQSITRSRWIIAKRNGSTDKIGAFTKLGPLPTMGAAFKAVFGGLVFTHDPNDGVDTTGNLYWAETHIPNITVYDNAFRDGYTGLNGARNVAHELGHAFAQRAGEQPYNDLTQNWNNADFPRRGDDNNGFAGEYPGWQQSTSATNREEFADMFLGWSYNRWSDSDAGRARSQWMTTNMADWMSDAIDQ